MLLYAGLELRHELRLATELEVQVDPVLERDEAKLVELCDVRGNRVFVAEIPERWPVPERECVTEQRGGILRISVTCLIAECLDPVDVALGTF